jgi:hypothetical protein
MQTSLKHFCKPSGVPVAYYLKRKHRGVIPSVPGRDNVFFTGSKEVQQ